MLVSPSMKEVFSGQFSGIAHIVVGCQKSENKLGGTANERWRQARRTDAKVNLDNGIRDVIKSTVNAICPEIDL
eukprot:6606837-Pyramimonas_sp.AAC.1